MLHPPDIFFTRGRGLISAAIRLFTRRIGEKRSKVNHVGLVVEGGPIAKAIVVEALSKVKRHGLVERYRRKGDEVAIYRPTNLGAAEVETIVKAAEGYVGRKYGWLMLAAHLADWVLQGPYLFRRLAGSDNYPICSWLVAHSFGKAGKHFGVAPGAADPDDIWDFVTNNADEYVQVRALGPL